MDKTVKEPIKIRQKKLANGNISLYLDIYLNGKRHYEFLRLYLNPRAEQSRQGEKQADHATCKLYQGNEAGRSAEP